MIATRNKEQEARRERWVASRGFTLIETLVAISLLTIAIVAPMTLASQSLESAYYARDQVTAFYLAQEGLEAVRAIRDGNILSIAENIPEAGACGSNPSLFCGIPVGQNFTIDARLPDYQSAIATCSGTCPPLDTNGTLYGYQSGWTPTNFTRTVYACYVHSDGTCTTVATDEVRVAVTVSWKTAAFQTRSFSIAENMYRWVNDGSAATS